MLHGTHVATLRLQMVQIIPSTSPSTHDLKRRLAMTLLFNNLSYASKHSHSTMILDYFINRLEGSDFDTGPETDYRELGALVSLLDIAVDDGRSISMDLNDDATWRKFDNDIDEFSGTIENVMKSIGNPSGM